jgi:glycosyltransferase involved in cell wall biosynthesis
MKIMYLTNQFYLHGGIEKMLAHKINHWIHHYGYEVVLCTTEQHNKSFVYSLDMRLTHIDLNINYHRAKSYFHPMNIAKSFTHFKQLNKTVRREKPDVIISVNYTPEQFLIPFIEKQIPKVKEFHSSGATLKDPKGFFEKAKGQLFKLFNRYDALVVLNEDEKQYYPFKNLKVVPNFIKLKNSKIELQKEKTIIAAGRIAPVKQFDHLIKAWALIAKDFPEWQVKIFGEGDESLIITLKKIILELEATNIHLMGVTNDLEEEMNKASIYAMTSSSECFPMVLLEAQSAGLAILSYDCPNGPRNIISDNKNGLLTALDQIDTFALKLKGLINDSYKRNYLSQNAKEDVKKFDEIAVMEKWNDLFLKLIKND